MRLSQRVIQRLPKTDIHCHLDGCVRPRTMLELATAQGVKLPTRNLAKLTRILQAGKRTRNLGDYLKIFDYTLSVLQEKDALYRGKDRCVRAHGERNRERGQDRKGRILSKRARAVAKIIRGHVGIVFLTQGSKGEPEAVSNYSNDYANPGHLQTRRPPRADCD